jgi:hypothetical protein
VLADLGVCGALEFIEFSDVHQGRTDFFDSAGVLVASENRSDINVYCDGTAYKLAVGPVPECTRRTTEKLCN